jgi:hypothetical protein
MMTLRLNWHSLIKLNKELDQRGFVDDTSIMVIVVLKDGTPRKSLIKFKQFLRFMWSLSEAKIAIGIKRVIIQDPSGNILYRQREAADVQETLPDADGGLHITSWSVLTDEEKDILLEMTIAQITSYGR